ncbi:MAG: helix-turn-helix transcriptional regulator [Clostridiaceae bacterium]|nr:helix-turn-helix transcriptional regulator [Clostridiaceae bacterium]
MKSKWYDQWFACGERIQESRKKIGLSREDFAEIIDISDKNLGRIESAVKPPVLKLCTKFHLFAIFQ